MILDFGKYNNKEKKKTYFLPCPSSLLYFIRTWIEQQKPRVSKASTQLLLVLQTLNKHVSPTFFFLQSTPPLLCLLVVEKLVVKGHKKLENV